jgi:hypothetical protein
MELETRKNDSKTEGKQKDILIEVSVISIPITIACQLVTQDLLSRSFIQLGDAKTRVEEVKWENMSRAVSESAFCPCDGSMLMACSDTGGLRRRDSCHNGTAA